MRKILIVDDSRVMRLVIRRIVESLGFAVDEAADGQQALERLRSAGPPDAVILDIVMPVMDGLSCLRAIRRDPHLKDCVVIMCTTQTEPAEIEAAVAAGTNEYIMKPFTDEILADKLRQVGLIE